MVIPGTPKDMGIYWARFYSRTHSQSRIPKRYGSQNIDVPLTFFLRAFYLDLLGVLPIQ